MDPAFRFRPGTSDEEIFRAVHDRNEYKLPDRFPRDAVIIDIGAHIGGFSYTAASRGATRIHAFEADPDNHRLADENLRRCAPCVTLRHAAVWRSDRKVDHLTIGACPEPENTGWREVFAAEGTVTVPAIAFDDIVMEVTDGGKRRVTLLKIDCEGSEFPILMTTKTLHLVDRIVGEWHEMNTPAYPEPIPDHARVEGVERFGREELCMAIERHGFEFWSRHYSWTRLGVFEAVRPAGTAGAVPRPKLMKRVAHGVSRRLSAAMARG